MNQPTPPVPLVAVAGSLLLGGATTFLVNLARAMARRGVVLPIVSLSELNEHAADFASTGQPVHLVPGHRLIYEDRLLAGYQAVARYAPRAVLACLGGESFEILRLVPAGTLRLGIVQSHEPGPYEVIRRFAPSIDRAVGVSKVVEETLAALPELRHAGTAWIPYGIDFPPLAGPRPAPGPSPLRLVYLGRLIEEQKRVSRLVELVRLLEERRCPVTLTIAGAGPDAATLRHRLASVGWVRFTGVLPNQETARLLAQSDVYLLLSDYEGLPLSLLEAMGQGVVPVVSDLPGGLREAVTEECGFRVPVGDVVAAARVIGQLASEPGLLAGRSRAAMEVAREHYHADRMAEQYLRLVGDRAGETPKWPAEIQVPAPLGLNPWLYSGLMRRLRRRLKPWLPR